MSPAISRSAGQCAETGDVVPGNLLRAVGLLRRRPPALCSHAEADHIWFVDGGSDPADQDALRRRHVRETSDEVVRDPSRRHVVELADVRDRVLAGRRFERHRPARRHEAVHAVPPPDLPVVTGLGRGAGHRQVKATRRGIVGRGHRDFDRPPEMLAGPLLNGHRQALLLREVVTGALDVGGHERARDRDVRSTLLTYAHHLDVFARLGALALDRGAVDPALDVQHCVLEP